MVKEKTITIAVVLPASQVKYLDDKASRNDQNRSQVVRQLVRDDMIKNKQEK